MNLCVKCGAELDPEAVFCSKCGKPVAEEKLAGRTCPHCGKTFDPGQIFCDEDGHRLDVRTSAQAKTSGGAETGTKPTDLSKATGRKLSVTWEQSLAWEISSGLSKPPDLKININGQDFGYLGYKQTITIDNIADYKITLKLSFGIIERKTILKLRLKSDRVKLVIKDRGIGPFVVTALTGAELLAT
jgi:DNA-directed RNA polymerase subunit RPC12/RpoP